MELYTEQPVPSRSWIDIMNGSNPTQANPLGVKGVNEQYLFDTQQKSGSQENIYASNLMLYDGVVDVYGHGDFVNIQDAIDAGKRRIYVRNGTYVLTANLEIPSNCLIQGEDKDSVIIQTGSYKVKTEGDTPYTTGTVSISTGTNVITGSGTSWEANLAVGDYILAFGVISKITAVNSDTEIEVEYTFEGINANNFSYEAGTYITDVTLRDLTIKGQTAVAASQAIYLYSTVNSLFENIDIVDNTSDYTYGLYTLYSHFNTFNKIRAEENYIGIRVSYSDYNLFNFCHCLNNQAAGFYADYSDSVQVSNGIFNGNYVGISIYQTVNSSIVNSDSRFNENVGFNYTQANYSRISNCNASNNLDGFFFNNSRNIEASTIIAKSNTRWGFIFQLLYNSSMVTSHSYFNGQNGMYLLGCNYDTFTTNNFYNNGQTANNTYSDIYISTYNSSVHSTYLIFKGNSLVADADNKCSYGIRELNTSQDYNTYEGNSFLGYATSNATLSGVNNELGHNIGF